MVSIAGATVSHNATTFIPCPCPDLTSPVVDERVTRSSSGPVRIPSVPSHSIRLFHIMSGSIQIPLADRRAGLGKQSKCVGLAPCNCDYSQTSGLHGNKAQTSGEYRFCFPKFDIQRLEEQLRGFIFGPISCHRYGLRVK